MGSHPLSPVACVQPDALRNAGLPPQSFEHGLAISTSKGRNAEDEDLCAPHV